MRVLLVQDQSPHSSAPMAVNCDYDQGDETYGDQMQQDYSGAEPDYGANGDQGDEYYTDAYGYGYSGGSDL